MVSELDEIRRRVRNIWGAISSNQVVDKDVEGQAKRLLEYIDRLRAALPTEPVQVGVKELLDEGLEILNGIIDSVKRHGNYSPESTCTFIDQAGQCLRKALTTLSENPSAPAQPANFEQAVAWQQYGKRTGWTNVDPDFAQTLAAGGERVRPLFTHPAPASPVTEEMVRAAYDEWIADVRELEPTWEQLPQSHKDRLRRSLEAASLASCRQVEGE